MKYSERPPLKKFHNSHFNKPQHTWYVVFKFIICVILGGTTLIIIIQILGSPQIIAPKRLGYNPVYTYFEW